jgi:outer membrane protein assembly factor BamB
MPAAPTAATRTQPETQKGLLNAILEAGGDPVHTALLNAAAKGQVEVVRDVLAKAKLPQEVLNKALAATSAKQEEIVKLLTGAGAAGAPKPGVRMDAKALQSFAGAYADENQNEMEIVCENGVLAFKNRARSVALEALDQTTFQMVGNENLKLSFQTHKGKVVGFTWQGPFRTATYKRMEKNRPVTDPVSKVVAEKPIKVAVPKNWPSFRGPNATGVADDQMPPTSWDINKGIHILWKRSLAGLGHSSPVVWHDRVFVTTAIPNDPKVKLQTGGDHGAADDSTTYNWRVYCLEKQTGKILWERTAHEGVPQSKRHAKATYANSTPATDGDLVVVCFGSEGLFCYDFQGNLVWKQSLGILDSGWAYDSRWKWEYGFGSSPILYRGLVIVQCDWGKTPFIAAYDLKTGKEAWRTPRAELPTHGTPTVYEGKDRAVLIANSASHVRGYDPLTGKELWSLGSDSGGDAVPTPVTGHDLIFATFGWSSGGPLFAIRPTAAGDISLKKGQTANDFIAWISQRDGPYLPTPLVYGDYLYCCSFRGMLSCLEAKTGKRLYRERLGGTSTYTASPIAADGKLYMAGEDGSIRVVNAGPKFELLAVNQMGEACLATPAISDGILFVRTLHDLIAIARRETAKSDRTK